MPRLTRPDYAAGLLIAVWAVALAVRVASGDAIVVTQAMKATTIAEIFIERDAVRVELEIGLEDLNAFNDVVPREIHDQLGREPPTEPQAIERFFQQAFTIKPDEFEPLGGAVAGCEIRKRTRRDKITGDPLSGETDNADSVVFLRLTYPLPDQLPDNLAIKPPTDSDGNALANIGFVAYHFGLPINDFRYLGREEQLELDWKDPWYSFFHTKNLRRTYDAPAAAYLYIEPFEVRHEIVIRPRDIEHWMDLQLRDENVIYADERDELKRRIGEFLLSRNPVTIDGKAAVPTLDRIHFVRRTLRKTSIVEPDEDLDLISATLGVIMIYPTDGLPQNVSMTWQLFSQKIDQLPTVSTDEAGGLPYTLSPDDPTLRWHNFLTNPTIPAMATITPPPRRPRFSIPIGSVVCAGILVVLLAAGSRSFRISRKAPAALATASVVAAVSGLLLLPYARTLVANPFSPTPVIAEDDATLVLSGLIQNTYRAFDRRDEGLVYDRLARSISGELLADIYLQIRRSMELENQGGARVKVREIELLEAVAVLPADELGFKHRCRWLVSGSVGHWGHTHQRANQYEATFTVQPIDGAWKITHLEMLDERRIDQSPPAAKNG